MKNITVSLERFLEIYNVLSLCGRSIKRDDVWANLGWIKTSAKLMDWMKNELRICSEPEKVDVADKPNDSSVVINLHVGNEQVEKDALTTVLRTYQRSAEEAACANDASAQEINEPINIHLHVGSENLGRTVLKSLGDDKRIYVVKTLSYTTEAHAKAIIESIKNKLLAIGVKDPQIVLCGEGSDFYVI